ncbi:hypothetical protein VV02_24055 [Luteipulveratus mongoliensis]|uniref:Adenylate kinase n=2 Tax=Luteipulveratus mongoliensis TaxID=571913 RepID=A0A0K1JNC0_9MICO|nr:hypothetical protein VV02_24055 [Luteipulveratus mongoliensis]
MEAGGLADESFIRSQVRMEMNRLANRHLIPLLDGFPRTVEQLAYLDTLLAPEQYRLVAVHIDAPKSVCLERISRRRAASVAATSGSPRHDDANDAAVKRMEMFDSVTSDLIVELTNSRTTVTIDGNQPESSVFAQAANGIARLKASRN